MILWYSHACRTASSVSSRAKMVLLRTPHSLNKEFSPNQAPASMSCSCPSPSSTTKELVSSFDSKRGSCATAHSAIVPILFCFAVTVNNRPTTTKTTSCSNCPASTTRSPALHCTHVCAWAMSAMKAAGAPKKSGKFNTVLLSNSSVSSRCMLGDNLVSNAGANPKLFSCLSCWRKLCSTRRRKSDGTWRRRMNSEASMICSTTESWKKPCVTCVSNETMAPLKKGARIIVTIARRRPRIPSGQMSPYPTVVTVIMTK
mmetsp:Transcript_9913/g.28774  ORF Transcript_9913/g.28774 Transcript_9913/m.28774 type:complete len:258 (+) Transcript_9913:428-1201(+)